MESLLAQGVDHIVVLALYPQYSCSTVAAVWDELARILATRRRIPGVTFIRDYADNDLYIKALANSARASFEKHGEPDLLLLSYHGIPQRFGNEGDDYPQRCRDTTRELVSALGLPPEKVMMTFQSRFGREPWLTPYTDETLKMLGEKGVKHIQVMSPGFSADCLETLEEIAVQNREFFLEAGGEKYEYIPALNDSPEHIDMMVNADGQIAADRPAGWVCVTIPGPYVLRSVQTMKFPGKRKSKHYFPVNARDPLLQQIQPENEVGTCVGRRYRSDAGGY